MSSTSLQKQASPGALVVKYLQKKFDALRYLPKVAYGVLQFNSAGELIADPNPDIRKAVSTYTADGAIALTGGIHSIEKTSAAAMTVAAPSSQDGTELTIVANTDFAHVITFTGSTLLDGTTGANLTVTLAAFKGSSLTVQAIGTKWLVKAQNTVTSITA